MSSSAPRNSQHSTSTELFSGFAKPTRNHLGRPRLFLILPLLAFLAGCASAVVGAGATVGVAALDERGVQAVARDAALATQVRAKWLGYDLDKGDTIAVDGSIKVYNRRALLTGMVKSEASRVTAVRMTWQVEGIEEVLNELAVGPGGIEDAARDTWITTQLTSKLTFDQDVKAINYSVTTSNAVIYMIGVAQSQAELRRALGHARSISRVRDVVNYMKILPPKPPAKESSSQASNTNQAS